MKKLAVTALVLTLGLAACTNKDADNAAVNETAVENAAEADVNAATMSADNALDAAGNAVDNAAGAVDDAANAVDAAAENAAN